MAKKNVDARNSMFGRLAMESGLVTHDEIVACIEEQERIRAEGATPPRLGEMLVEREILTQEEVDTILRMQSNPGGLIGRQLLENDLVTREQLRECLDEQAEYHRTNRVPPRLGEMVVAKGWVKQEELNLLLRWKETPGHLFGEFLIANRIVTEEGINQCLAIQKEQVGRGEKPDRLGGILVKCGLLRKEQVELYYQRHLQGKKSFTGSASAVPMPKHTESKVVRGDLMMLDSLGQHVDGVTYKCVHVPTGAVVVGHSFTDAEPEGLLGESFDAKCEQAFKLRHPAVQPLFSSEMVNDRRVLVAEYIEGVTLDQILGQQEKIGWTWALEMLSDFSSALAAAAALKLYHDDIRPGSILVDYSGKARLALWAYTRDPLVNREWLAKRHKKIAFYNAPERSRTGPNERSDIFSLGITLIRAITGISILNGGSFIEALKKSSPADAVQNLAIDMTLPLGFVSILARMVEANPANRFASFHDLHDAVNAFREEQGLEVTAAAPAAVIEVKKMGVDEANRVAGQFLEAELVVVGTKKVSWRRLARFYSGPIVAMLVIMLLTTAVYRTTQASHGLMVRANWLDLQGDKSGALGLYRIISTLYPEVETVQRRYYDLALEVGDHGEAEIALERLMPFHPDEHTEYLELQADLQVWQNRFLSAVDLYRQVLTGRQYDIALRTKLASALLWAQSYQEAQREFTDLIVLDPTNNVLVLGLARAAAGNKDVATATRMFEQLNRQGLLPQEVFMEYAWMLHDEGMTEELKELAQSALRRKETNEFRSSNLTYINLWAGNYADARQMLERQTMLDRNSREYLEMRITIDDHLGNIDAVIDNYKALAEIEPANPEPLLIVAGHYQGRGDFENADIYLRQALARSGDDETVKLAIARNLAFMRNFAEAERWYRDILQATPSNRDAARGLVESLLETEQYAAAREYVERLYRENPYDRQNRVNLAVVYTWLDMMKEAYPIIDSLLAENILTEDERDLLAVNAMRSGANNLLFRIIGAGEGDPEKLREYRLILARRMRGEGRHTLSLALYAAVIASMPSPDVALLMEAAETANWAERYDIAVTWLEMAREIAAQKERGGYTAGVPIQPGQFRLSTETWDSLLEPLRREPELYDTAAGLRKLYSSDAN